MLERTLLLFMCIVCLQLTADGGRGFGGGLRGNIGNLGLGRGPPKASSYPKQQWGIGSPSVSNKAKSPTINRGIYQTGGRGGSKFGSGGRFSTFKGVGLGVGAGFLTGYALGSFATFGLYHRYYEYQRLLYLHQHGYWTDDYYNNYYKSGKCFQDCPTDAHCTFGICECNSGFIQKFGTCYKKDEKIAGRPNNFDPYIPCTEGRNCQGIDMNLVCNTTLPSGGRCECRRNMKWNNQTGECDLYLDVDCTSVKRDSIPSPVVAAAINATNYNETDLLKDSIANEQASSINSTLTTSILAQIDPDNTTETELKEAYCRDVEFFSNKYARYTLPPENTDSGAVGIGVAVAVILFFCISCCCLACCCRKKVKSRFASLFFRRDHSPPPVNLSNNQTKVDRSYPPKGLQFPATNYQSAYLTPGHQAGTSINQGFYINSAAQPQPANHAAQSGYQQPGIQAVGAGGGPLPYPPAAADNMQAGNPLPYPPAVDNSQMGNPLPYPSQPDNPPPYSSK